MASLAKLYSRIFFKNSPSQKTPLNEANLNKMDKAINDLDDRVVDVNEQLGVERARIDNIASLPEGSTTGDAELIDGRTDYKGTTHTNIGAHIRDVSSQLSSEIDNKTKPFFDVSTFVNGDRTGTMISHRTDRPYRACTIEIKHIERDTTVKIADGWRMYVYYNNDGSTTIDGTVGWQTGEYTFISSETSYITVVVSKVPEDTTETLDLSEVSNAITVKTFYGEIDDRILNVESETKENTKNIHVVDSVSSYVLGGINMMARLGYRGSDESLPYEQTKESYKLAYKNWYKIMIFDLMVTSDGEFVCSHETDLKNKLAGVRNLDGSTLSNSVIVAESTLSQLNEYDYGIIRGQQYSQVGITTIAWGLEFCKVTNTIMHIELKSVLSSEQVVKLENMIKSYGMQDRIILNFTYGQYASMKNDLISFANMFPNIVLAYCTDNITDSQLTVLNALRTSGVKNPLFIFLSEYTSITEENVLLCSANNIDVGYSEIRTESQLEEVYLSGALKYIKFISSYINVYDFYKNKYVL